MSLHRQRILTVPIVCMLRRVRETHIAINHNVGLEGQGLEGQGLEGQHGSSKRGGMHRGGQSSRAEL